MMASAPPAITVGPWLSRTCVRRARLLFSARRAPPWSLLVVIVTCLFGWVTLVPAQNLAYEHASVNVYDAARVIGYGGFSRPALLERFKSFSAGQCADRRLARWIVAADERSLMNSINVHLPPLRRDRIANLLRADPTLIGANLGPMTAAQVLCFGGSVTALVRQGDRLTRYQLGGSQDSREVNLRGQQLTIVGFELDSVPRTVAKDDPSSLPDQVWIYARMHALPTLEGATVLRSDLESLIGVQTRLVVRTDPFFFDYRGPRTDVFEVPTANISTEQYLNRPYIVWWPGGGCRLVESPRESLASPRPPVR